LKSCRCSAAPPAVRISRGVLAARASDATADADAGVMLHHSPCSAAALVTVRNDSKSARRVAGSSFTFTSIRKARHMFAMAVAAGGPEAQASREQLTRLAASPDDAVKEIAGAAAELLQERTVKLSGMPSVKGSARFALVFEASNQPSRAEYLDGDAALQGVGDKLRSQTFPVRFPDVSSVKIIRRAKVTCDGTGCSAVLLPVESLQP